MRQVLLISSIILTLSSGISQVQDLTNDGALTITIDGKEETKYVSCASWSPNGATTSGNSFTLNGNTKCYLTDTPGVSADSLYQFQADGKKLCFNVDNSKVHCNCNSALYFVKMPAKNQNGQTENNNLYCDANEVGGNWCPEMDISEANAYALQVTPHTCSAPQNGHYWWCDRGGCATNIKKDNYNSIGPGSEFKIDTQKAYTQCITFGESQYEVSLTQGENSYNFSDCGNQGYIQQMNNQMSSGMVFVFSLWGTGEGGMSWLDGTSGCSGPCTDMSEVTSTYSNITIS